MEDFYKIEYTNLSLKTIRNKEYYPKKLADVNKANMLLYPYENFRENEKLLFPETTREFFDYLKANAPDDLIPEVAVDDDDFQEIELHDITIIIPSFIVTSIMLPIAINLVSNFIQKIIDKRAQKKANAKLEIVISEKNKKIKYDGPAGEMKDILLEAVKHLEDK